MKNAETKKCNLKFEEMEEVQEFSFGSVGFSAFAVTVVILLSQVLF